MSGTTAAVSTAASRAASSAATAATTVSHTRRPHGQTAAHPQTRSVAAAAIAATAGAQHSSAARSLAARPAITLQPSTVASASAPSTPAAPDNRGCCKRAYDAVAGTVSYLWSGLVSVLRTFVRIITLGYCCKNEQPTPAASGAASAPANNTQPRPALPNDAIQYSTSTDRNTQLESIRTALRSAEPAMNVAYAEHIFHTMQTMSQTLGSKGVQNATIGFTIKRNNIYIVIPSIEQHKAHLTTATQAWSAHTEDNRSFFYTQLTVNPQPAAPSDDDDDTDVSAPVHSQPQPAQPRPVANPQSASQTASAVAGPAHSSSSTEPLPLPLPLSLQRQTSVAARAAALNAATAAAARSSVAGSLPVQTATTVVPQPRQPVGGRSAAAPQVAGATVPSATTTASATAAVGVAQTVRQSTAPAPQTVVTDPSARQAPRQRTPAQPPVLPVVPGTTAAASATTARAAATRQPAPLPATPAQPTADAEAQQAAARAAAAAAADAARREAEAIAAAAAQAAANARPPQQQPAARVEPTPAPAPVNPTPAAAETTPAVARPKTPIHPRDQIANGINTKFAGLNLPNVKQIAENVFEVLMAASGDLNKVATTYKLELHNAQPYAVFAVAKDAAAVQTGIAQNREATLNNKALFDAPDEVRARIRAKFQVDISIRNGDGDVYVYVELNQPALQLAKMLAPTAAAGNAAATTTTRA